MYLQKRNNMIFTKMKTHNILSLVVFLRESAPRNLQNSTNQAETASALRWKELIISLGCWACPVGVFAWIQPVLFWSTVDQSDMNHPVHSRNCLSTATTPSQNNKKHPQGFFCQVSRSRTRWSKRITSASWQGQICKRPKNYGTEKPTTRILWRRFFFVAECIMILMSYIYIYTRLKGLLSCFNLFRRLAFYSIYQPSSPLWPHHQCVLGRFRTPSHAAPFDRSV